MSRKPTYIGDTEAEAEQRFMGIAEWKERLRAAEQARDALLQANKEWMVARDEIRAERDALQRELEREKVKCFKWDEQFQAKANELLGVCIERADLKAERDALRRAIEEHREAQVAWSSSFRFADRELYKALEPSPPPKERCSRCDEEIKVIKGDGQRTPDFVSCGCPPPALEQGEPLDVNTPEGRDRILKAAVERERRGGAE